MTTATIQATRPSTRVPTELEFGDEAYIPAPGLEALAETLVEKYSETLGHLADVQVAYLWRKAGGKKSGAPVFGKAIKPSGVLTAFTQAEAVVWLAADHVAAAEYSPKQIEALLFHELNHIAVEEPGEDDEDGARKVVLRGHDIEAFKAEVVEFGAWEELLQEAAEAFAQAPLFQE